MSKFSILGVKRIWQVLILAKELMNIDIHVFCVSRYSGMGLNLLPSKIPVTPAFLQPLYTDKLLALPVTVHAETSSSDIGNQHLVPIK